MQQSDLPKMDIFDKEQLTALATTESSLCVSMYMPTFHVESERSQNPIRFKNLVKQTSRQLAEEDVRDEDIDQLLKPVRQLLDDNNFWLSQSDGFAAFLTPEEARFYRLPLDFEELVVTGGRFHLKPLFPLIASNNVFYLLALSQNKVRLYQGTHYTIAEIESDAIPKSLEEALPFEERERSVQHHVANRAGNRHDASFHGHGAASGDDNKREPHDELKRFCRHVDEGVREVLEGENAPLVLAGVDSYLSIYREVSRLNSLVGDSMVTGNPDHLSAKELHEKAWGIVEPLFSRAQDDAIEQFHQLHANGAGLASQDLKEIIPAAMFSRIDTLFVPVGKHIWGTYDEADNAVSIHEERQPGDDDLLDLAAFHTYVHGGTVHALREENMPAEGELAATFRYAADVKAEG